jgi:HK97 gp10 family phage protein
VASKTKWIRVKGGEELTAALKQLEPRFAKKIVRQAIRTGLKPLLFSAKSHAPSATGAMRAAIKIKAIKRVRNRFGLQVVIGEGNFVGKTFYGAFQEFGWKTGKRESDPANRKQIEGKHFMQKAADDLGTVTIESTRGLLATGLEQVAKELGSKH